MRMPSSKNLREARACDPKRVSHVLCPLPPPRLSVTLGNILYLVFRLPCHENRKFTDTFFPTSRNNKSTKFCNQNTRHFGNCKARAENPLNYDNNHFQVFFFRYNHSWEQKNDKILCESIEAKVQKLQTFMKKGFYLSNLFSCACSRISTLAADFFFFPIRDIFGSIA